MSHGPPLPGRSRDRLVVALDVATHRDALLLAQRLGEEVAWVKVGLELFVASGPGVVRDLAALGKKIFLDLKFHDIPNTVAGAVASAARLPVNLLNVHGSAGPKALAAAAEAAASRDDLGVLAVTRLTSDDSAENLERTVLLLAEQAAQAGLFGVVCPASTASLLRDRFGDSLARLCPGIRPAGSAADDQVHVATPEIAVASGAHWIVVGRPITRAPDPAAGARAVLSAMDRD